MTGIKLDYETADQITLAVMQEHCAMLKAEIEQHMEKGTYMHPDDLARNQQEIIPALETLIRYFGG
jgi:hypothetical protein